MKKFLLTLFCLIVTTNTYANSMDLVEYYFDTDPGYGNGVQIPLVEGDSYELAADISSLAVGSHVLYVRAKEILDTGESVWSIVKSRPFYKNGTVPANGAPALTKLEYYFDEAPLVGEETEITLGTGTDQAIEQDLDLTNLKSGHHILYVRAQDDLGNWSIAKSRPFLLESKPFVTAVTYFLDNDPGYLSRAEYLFDSQEYVASANLAVSTTGVPSGLHSFYYRGHNSLGQRTKLYNHEFLKKNSVVIDTDNDGIADDWESYHLGDLTTADAVSDYDGDEYTDLQEYKNDIEGRKDNDDFFYDPMIANAPNGYGYQGKFASDVNIVPIIQLLLLN